MTKYCRCGHQKAEHFPVKGGKHAPSGRFVHNGKEVPKKYCCHSYILFGCDCEKYDGLKNTKTVWRDERKMLVNAISGRKIHTTNDVGESINDRNNFGQGAA
mgnify:FL=1